MPATSGQLRPAGSASAYTATSGSASSRCTGRCRVGRPATTTCAGRSSGALQQPRAGAHARRPAGRGRLGHHRHAVEPAPSSGPGRRARPGPASGRPGRAAAGAPRGSTAAPRSTAGRRPGRAGSASDPVGHQRLGEGQVELHRAGRAAEPAGRRGHRPVHRGPDQPGVGVGQPGHGQPDGAPEDARLHDRLVGPGADRLRRAGRRSGPAARPRRARPRAPPGAGWPPRCPDVVATGTGRPERSASPSARNPAVRSSMRTCSRSRPAASAACSANDSGALREPGHSTASVTPHRTSSSTTSRACSVERVTTVDPAPSSSRPAGSRSAGSRYGRLPTGQRGRVELALAHPGRLGHHPHRVLQPLPVGHPLVHRADQRVDVRRDRRGRAGQHDGDLAAHRPDGRPLGQLGQRPAEHLLVGLGQLPADRGRPVRSEHLDRGGQRVAQPVRRLEEHARPAARRPASAASAGAPPAGAARTPRSRTGRTAARTAPARWSPRTGRAGRSPAARGRRPRPRSGSRGPTPPASRRR